MAKQTPNYALVFVIFAISAVITCWLACRPNAALFTPHLGSFPKSVGHWYGEELALNAETLRVLNADEVLCRGYRSTDEDPVALLVVYRKYGRREFAHRPEACYPAAGWEIADRGYITVPYGGHSIRAVKVVARRGDSTEITFYWFASGRETEANYIRQQFDMALDRLRTHKYGWAFIRITSPVTRSEAATIAGMRHFLRNVSCPLADTLSGSEMTGVPPAEPARVVQ